MRPALLLVAGDLDAGVPGVTEDPAVADALLGAALEVARATGGVGRVLLFSPPEAEASLTARALGFRLWPADGATDGVRWANAFRQAGELGYEGAVVVGLGAAGISAARLTEVVDLLAANPAVVIPDDRGTIAVLGLQRPEPTLLPPGPVVPDVDTLRTRARQLRIAVHELPPHPAISADDLPRFLAAGG